jgi:hypothetical protein
MKGWLNVDDPLLSVSAGINQDPEVQKLTALLSAWKNAFGKQGATIPEAIRRAKDRDDVLFDVLDEIAGERGVINSRRMGRWIERHAKRIADRHYFASSGKRQNYNVWIVCEAEPGEFRENRECSNPQRVENGEQSFLYSTTPEISPNYQNSPAGNGADTQFVTCSSCANFEPNLTNPSFQGRCSGYPPDGDRLKFPHLKHDCSEFRKRAEA